jgi:cytochrome c peroxidase
VKIKSTMGGNGHSETWDGRLFVIAKNTDQPPHTVGWVVRAFRPERVKSGENGALDFSDQAFSQEAILELDGTNGSHNAHAVVAAPGFPENPFRSDDAGNAVQGGAYLTYELIVYAQNYEDGSKLQARRARVVVKDPYTADASVLSAQFVGDFAFAKTKTGNTLRAIEPTLSEDGRLLIMQGHPDNDGKIDYLVYSYNETPGALEGWTDPRYITDMYAVDRDSMVDGIKFAERYPIAQQPLLDGAGVAYAAGEAFHGAYPWISHDGTELFYMALVAGDNDARPGERARRGGASVIGRWTNWTARHIDGPINPSRDGKTPESTVRLFFSSPGAFTTMWSPFPQLGDQKMPYTANGPAYPLFGSNTGDYNEVSFEDFLDRNYVVALRMNELVSHVMEADPSTTPDTSGNFNNGKLEGATFPIEYNGVDEIVGFVGQGLYFPENGGVRVAGSASFDRLASALSVELFVKRRVDMAQDGENRFEYLVNKPGSFSLVLEESGQIQASVVVAGTELRSGAVGTPLPIDQWVHVAFTYDAATGTLRTYQNGAPVGEATSEPGDVAPSDGDLLVGPAAQTAAAPFVAAGTPVVLLDELLISDVVRSADELARSAYACAPSEPSLALGELPLGLRASELRVPAGSVNTEAARTLGAQLFFDQRLSKDEDVACVTCHTTELDYTDGRVTALGLGPKFLSRNTPSLLNRALSSHQFWDGKSESLEAQALIPIENPEEMNLPLDEAVSRLGAIPGYVEGFQTAFGAPPSAELIGKALAAFQRSLLSGNSRVDQFEAGDFTALDEGEQRGRRIFHGKARCTGCHSGSNYTDERFHNNGLVCVGDVGRSEVTERERDLGSFKTPSLRSVSRTAPYGHDGSLATLADVVAAYNRGGDHSNNLDTEIRALGLSTEEQADLVRFLEALAGTPPEVDVPTLP